MEFLERIVRFVENTYRVSPWVFIILYLLSIPIYWYGWYKVALGLWDRDWRKTAWGITINRLAWFLPYLYVIFQGKNLPKWFWISLFVLITSSSALFATKVKGGNIPKEVRWIMGKLGRKSEGA